MLFPAYHTSTTSRVTGSVRLLRLSLEEELCDFETRADKRDLPLGGD